MLRFQNYDIVFQEVPGEVSLAINIANCPNRCPNCHTPSLWDDEGALLNQHSLQELLSRYGGAITCVCFMGGDSDTNTIEQLAGIVKNAGLSSAWYSGRSELPEGIDITNFDFIKIGPYIKQYGPISEKTTNQKFYHVSKKMELIDKTFLFQSK